MWAFVVDPVHDRKILDVIDGRKIDLAPNNGNFLESGLVALIDIKRESLGTLIDRVGRWSSEEKPEDSFSLSSLVLCLRMASSLSLALPRVRAYESVRRNSQVSDTAIREKLQCIREKFEMKSHTLHFETTEAA